MCRGSAGQAKHTNEGWQRESLKDERDQNGVEGEEDDHAALRERSAIVKRLRQSDGGGKRDNPAHSGPANDENLADTGHRIPLMKNARANEIGQISAGEIPGQAHQN